MLPRWRSWRRSCWFVELPLLGIAAAGGWLGPKLRAWVEVLAWLPCARRERRAVQRVRVVDVDTFAAGLV